MKGKSITAILLSGIIGLVLTSPMIVEQGKAKRLDEKEALGLKCIAHLEENKETGAPVVITENESLFNYQETDTQKELPQNYSLVDEGETTKIRNQGNHGTCWSFGMLASLESNMIKYKRADKNVDLSERHLTWFTYNPEMNEEEKSLSPDDRFAGLDHWHTVNLGNPYANGGNREMVSSTLARGFGAVDESKAPYNGFVSATLPGYMAGESNHRIKNFDYLPEIVDKDIDSEGNITYNDTKQESIETVKRTLMKQGAVAIAFHQTDDHDKSGAYFNKDNGAFYCYNDRWSNHEVCIVGWDDAYKKENFMDFTSDGKIPPADGAFIVKNSWGEDWGNEGYFYLSYYDHSLAEPASLQGEDTPYSIKSPTHEFDRTYQYDGIGFGDFTYVSDKEFKQANAFAMHKSETIKAVGISTRVAESHVDIKLYKNGKIGKPESGILVGEQQFVQRYPGFHTVALNRPIDAVKGDRITAVFSSFHMEKNKKVWDVMLEATTDVDISWFHAYGQCKKRQTYINRAIDKTSHVTGAEENWSDVSNLLPLNEVVNNYDTPVKLGNATIKLLTHTHNTSKGHVRVPKSLTIETGKSKSINAKILAGDGKITYKAKKGKTIFVNSRGVVKGIQPGFGTVQVTVPATMKYDGVTKNVLVTVLPETCRGLYIKNNGRISKVKWQKAKGVSGYQIGVFKKRNMKRPYKTVHVSSKVRQKDMVIKKGQRMYISVRAYKKVGSKTLYGKWSRLKRIR